MGRGGGGQERDEDTAGGVRDGSVDGRRGCGVAPDAEVEGEIFHGWSGGGEPCICGRTI